MTTGIERFVELTEVAPPSALDDLVRRRMHAVLRNRAVTASRGERGCEGEHPAAAPRPMPIAVPRPVPLPMPLVERWVYTAGLVAYGSQALMGAARLLWRVVTG